MISSLNAYYIFYMAAQCGNISGAARKLYISQPAVSKAIAKVEESFHCPLLIRSSRGVRLTEAGDILYQQLNTAFSAIRSGEEQLRKNEESGIGSLSIGVSTTLCKYVLMPYLQKYLRENPHVRVSIFCQSTYETIASLENGSLDIGLVGETDHLEHLSFHPLKSITDIFVGTQEYLELLKKCADIQTCMNHTDLFANATLLLLDKNNVTRKYVDRYMLLQNITSEQLIEATTMDLLIDFAKIGLGLACVIKEFVADELKKGSLVQFHTREPIPARQIGFAFPKNAPATHAMNQFLAMIPTADNQINSGALEPGLSESF